VPSLRAPRRSVAALCAEVSDYDDFRFAIRAFASSELPIVAVLTLALGIGARQRSSAWSVPCCFVLAIRGAASARRHQSLLDLRDVGAQNHTLAGFGIWASNLQPRPERREPASASAVISPEVLPLLGVTPLLGRTFTPRRPHRQRDSRIRIWRSRSSDPRCKEDDQPAGSSFMSSG
jgi:hypothetical protein